MKHPDTTTTPPGGYKYTQPETGVSFHYFTWAEILTYVGKHRLGNGLDLAWGWEDRLQHDFCAQNPHIQCRDDEIPSSEDSPIQIQGRLLWTQLHAFTEQYPESPTEDDKSNARYFLAEWRSRIPQFGCGCRSEWARLTSNFPPDLSSREGFVTWAIQAHDRISQKLGKPLFRPDLFEQANFGGF